MNTYAPRRPRPFPWAKAFLLSVGAHSALAGLWVGALVLELQVFEQRERVPEISSADPMVTLNAEVVRMLQDAAREPAADVAQEEPKLAEKSFLPTRASQETSEPVKSARYFGERNTAAASEGEAVDNGLEVPTQEGSEARSPRELELANSDFADGEAEGSPGRPGEPLPLSPTALTQEQDIVETVAETPILAEVVLEPEPPSELEQEEMDLARAAELLALEDSITMPQKEEKLSPPEPQPEPKAHDEPSEAIPPPKPQARTLAGGVPGERGLEGGYDREARKTRLQGTIRRRGESSLEVEDSVKGRFLAQVNREIERAWQRECILRREHILPGVLAVSFVMNETGKVTGFRFDSRIAGGAIQEGFTMRAIQKANLPAMPKELSNELDGNQLEMSLTFYF